SFFIYFYDAELQEQSNAPIGQTLADFLLRSDLSLSGDITVTDLRREGGLLQITLTQTADPGAGSITLGFQENPMWLKKWRVTDSLGNVTEIELFEMQTGISLDRSLFIYSDPKRFEKPRYNN
ncbi:MAG: outer-membrane lipoprotein carrier protein LolA, partial [Pseudomonadota bacterium]|nr:outer-membrane lipoprotein carrier protein LolA [Pseudomonadota bacterium]